MKYIIICFLLFLGNANIEEDLSVVWIDTYSEAENIAQRDGKLIFLYFWSSSNEQCRRMDIETFSKVSTGELLRKFVPTRIDFTLERDIANRFGVAAIPTIVMVDAYGVVLEKLSGLKSNAIVNTRTNDFLPDVLQALTKSQIEQMLDKYPGDVKQVTHAIGKLEKNNKDASVMGDVVEAYQLTSVRAKKYAKSNFLAESNRYLNRLKKILKKSGSKINQERYEVLQLTQEVYREKPQKGVDKLLSFMQKTELDDASKAWIHFSLYNAYVMLEQKRKSSEQLEMLKSCDDAESYLDIIG